MRSLFGLVAALLFVGVACGQTYELVDPSGLVGATVEVDRGRLALVERTGERLYFSREARYDSPDGRFVGFLNFELNRILRFPRSGSGQMQTADLDDPNPQFRHTVRIVRPFGSTAIIRQAPLSGFGGPVVPFDRSAGPVMIPPYHLVPYVDPYITGYRGLIPQPQSVLIDSQTVPNPPLPPARVTLRNDGPREVQVSVVDMKNPSGTRSMRIAAGDFVEVSLDRDSGAKQVQKYRVVTALGETISKEIVRDVPPTARYELVVHEWRIQSVAIDRTAGAGENPIEDINFQGRGIGRFLLPPGPELQSGTIDVYSAARSRGNEATIAPIVPDDNRGDDSSPLEQAIRDAQRG